MIGKWTFFQFPSLLLLASSSVCVIAGEIITLIPALPEDSLLPTLPQIWLGLYRQGCRSPIPHRVGATCSLLICGLCRAEQCCLRFPASGYSFSVFFFHFSLSACPLNVLPWLHSFLGLFESPADAVSVGNLKYLDSFSCLPQAAVSPQCPQAI